MRGGQYGWLIFFMSLCMGLLFISLRVMNGPYTQGMSKSEEVERRSSMEQDYFKNIRYYYYGWGAQEKRFHLSADELQNNPKIQKVVFLNPAGTIQLEGSRILSYRGKRGYFVGDREELHLKDDVSFSEGNSSMASSQAVYRTGKKELQLRGDVVGLTRLPEHRRFIRVGSHEAFAWLLARRVRYLGGVKGGVESPRGQGQKLSFSSETLDMDLQRYHLDIDKDVMFKRERLEARGNRGEIFWNRKNKNIEHYVLHDNVQLKEQVRDEDGDGFFERTALAEKLEGTFEDDRVVLTGRPQVVQREDVIKGNRIVLKKDSEVVEVDDASANFRLRR